MSARHSRNSLAPIAAQVDKIHEALQSMSGDISGLRESLIKSTTETDLRLDNLERSVRARAQRGDKIRLGAVMALIGATISTGVGLILNAVL
jgi:hypothetical protein